MGADSLVAWGAFAGGCTELEAPAEVLPEEWWVAPVERLLADVLAVLLPGNALAATSERTAVSATLPAISQRLTWCSRFIAASRSKRL